MIQTRREKCIDVGVGVRTRKLTPISMDCSTRRLVTRLVVRTGIFRSNDVTHYHTSTYKYVLLHFCSHIPVQILQLKIIHYICHPRKIYPTPSLIW